MVRAWLIKRGLGQYCDRLLNEGVESLEDLSLVDDELLDAIGVTNIIHRKKFVHATSAVPAAEALAEGGPDAADIPSEPSQAIELHPDKQAVGDLLLDIGEPRGAV